jgi:hypothetical protein
MKKAQGSKPASAPGAVNPADPGAPGAAAKPTAPKPAKPSAAKAPPPKPEPGGSAPGTTPLPQPDNTHKEGPMSNNPKKTNWLTIGLGAAAAILLLIMLAANTNVFKSTGTKPALAAESNSNLQPAAKPQPLVADPAGTKLPTNIAGRPSLEEQATRAAIECFQQSNLIEPGTVITNGGQSVLPGVNSQIKMNGCFNNLTGDQLAFVMQHIKNVELTGLERQLQIAKLNGQTDLVAKLQKQLDEINGKLNARADFNPEAWKNTFLVYFQGGKLGQPRVFTKGEFEAGGVKSIIDNEWEDAIVFPMKGGDNYGILILKGANQGSLAAHIINCRALQLGEEGPVQFGQIREPKNGGIVSHDESFWKITVGGSSWTYIKELGRLQELLFASGASDHMSKVVYGMVAAKYPQLKQLAHDPRNNKYIKQ